jgi:hypothetical protein
VEAKADYLARGMKCPECNTGFIPEKIELRQPFRLPEGKAARRATTVGSVLVLAALVGMVNILVGIGIGVLGLLAVIAGRLGERKG